MSSPFRIALIGDFSGRGNRGLVEKGKALAARRPLRVDRDSVDLAIARLAPKLELALASNDERIDVEFSSLDDFHPDSLYQRLPYFRGLRDAGSRATATSLLAAPRSPGSAPASTTPASALDAILADAPLPPGGAALAKAPPRTTVETRSDGGLSEFVQCALAPHLIAAPDPSVADVTARIDALVTAELRALLHHPAFQSLEAAWRGVDFLVRRIDTDAALQIHLVDVSRDELAADLATDEVDGTGLHRLLVDNSIGTPGGAPWALLVGLFTLGDEPNEVSLLGRIGRIARDAGAPFVVGGAPRLAGAPSIAELPDPDDWSEELPTGWSELRASSVAPYLSVVLPRLLLRLPYGKRGDACEFVDFEEMIPDTRPAHESFLWGNGSLAAALLLGEAFAETGWSLRPGHEISGLTLHVYRADGETLATPCAEVILTERTGERLLEHGLSPLLSVRDADAVVLPRLESIADPLTPLMGRWTMAGHADGA